MKKILTLIFLTTFIFCQTINYKEEKELEILYPMILIRLCLSVTLGEFQQNKEPDNKYLGISQKPVRKLLENLQNHNVSFVHHLFRNACFYEPSKKSFELYGFTDCL